MGFADDRSFYNIINGEKRTAKSTHRVTDPRTEDLLWEVPIATTQDLEEAVTAAHKAFQSWKWSTLPERQEVLAKICQVIEDNAAELADIARKETGKSILMGQIEIGNTTRQIKVIGTSNRAHAVHI
jgi:acyl-CoA reductase-like NAD-dependent aldehyde dehydrogenase